jgi:2-dehydro-3-deoxy-D-arabinonate dehydratase
MALCRYGNDSHTSWGWVREGRVYLVPEREVLQSAEQPTPEGLARLENLGDPDNTLTYADLENPTSGLSQTLLAPVIGTEIWAAGVTYESSKFARMAESDEGGDFYAKVYTADRPELFFKATPSRTVGPNAAVRIRADATWNVPEPELAAVIASDGTILGYTVGNDMSSRDIEGANPLYLPQAKVYQGCCALGPVIVPAAQVDARNLGIRLTISRGGDAVFTGETSTARMRRTVDELAGWLFRENEFPHGVTLLTGTGIIPPEDFTLHPGDEVAIEISGIGVLRNRVVQGVSV